MDRRSDALDPVARYIIQDDDVALLHLGNEELFQSSAELLAVHRAVERARRDETVLPQRADEGGRLPMPHGTGATSARRAACVSRVIPVDATVSSKRPDCPVAIRPAAPAIAGEPPLCRRDPALRRVATFFKRQPEMTDPRPQAADADLHRVIVGEPGLQLDERDVGFLRHLGAQPSS